MRKDEYSDDWKKTMRIISDKNMYSVMNDTKWRELRESVLELPYGPSFLVKYIDRELDEKLIKLKFERFGYWVDDNLGPFFLIEWIKVKPQCSNFRGQLIDDEIIDETEQFVSILKKYSIPYEEENGVYTIYGYKKI